MYVKHFNWSVEKLQKLQSKIDPSPQYQRGSVWKLSDKQLLIDSILRGFDIPKIYLRKVNSGGYGYEVADGQQRLLALWGFLDDEYPLSKSCTLSNCSGLYFSDLPQSASKNISENIIVTTIVYDSSGSDIRDLFVRLQRGVILSPPEIRNAIPSQLGDIIRGMALNHKFFKSSPFKPDRFKTDDLLAHSFLLELNEGNTDLKAPQLRQMYHRYAGGIDSKIAKQTSEVLDTMNSMQVIFNKCINRKWGYVDVYWAISQMKKRGEKLDAKVLAERYHKFERRRLKYVSSSEELLTEEASSQDRDLYHYIEAFKISGGAKENVKKRHQVLSKVFK